MNAFLSLGRWLFAIPFAILGLINFLSTKTMVESFVPNYMPAPAVWVYLGGVGLVAASVSMLIGKYDKLACTLLAVYLLGMVGLVHMPGAMAGGISAQFLLFKDLALAGAAMMYAQNLAKDRSVIG
jgi:putative oxidoreductase